MNINTLLKSSFSAGDAHRSPTTLLKDIEMWLDAASYMCNSIQDRFNLSNKYDEREPSQNW